MNCDILVIAGPTGVGKTKLSIELAKRLNAEIINGDAMQVYKKMNIGTAKVREEEKENIPHYLFDIVEPSVNYTVFDYQKDGRAKIKEILGHDKKVIIVGGTGLYIKALLYDYDFKEGTTTNNYENLNNEELLEEIKKYNKDINVHVNNRKRLVRYLNKYENNESIESNKDNLLYNAKFIGLTTERENLYSIIDNRVDKMISDGLIEEAEELIKNYQDSKALQTAIGYKEFIPYFNNEESKEIVIENIKKNSRHYAKRQYTFFKNQFNMKWFNVDYKNFNNTINEVLDYLKESSK